jgi:hypothetical protein
MIAVATSTLFFACSKSTHESKEITNVTTKFESPTLPSNQQLKLDEFSTLSANFLNELNSLNKANFCSFKTIVESTITNAEKTTALAANTSLSNVYLALSELKDYALTSNPNDFITNTESNQYFLEQLKLKTGFLDRPVAGGGPDCRAYLAAHDACSFNWGICMGAIFLAGPEAWIPGSALCAVALLGCCNSNDGANPACAAYYSGKVLPNIPNKSGNLYNICN